MQGLNKCCPKSFLYVPSRAISDLAGKVANPASTILNLKS